MLLALALLLIVGSIGVVSTTVLLDQRSFESSLDRVQEQLQLIRLHAQRTSTMIEVAYEPDKNSIVACVFELTDQEDSTDQEFRLHQKRWAYNQLDSGITLTQSDSDQSNITAIDDRSKGLEESVTPFSEQRWSLLVFLPSGGCANLDQVYLTDDHGRRAELLVEPLTGQIAWARIEPVQSKSGDQFELEDAVAHLPELSKADQLRAHTTNQSRTSTEAVYP